MGAKVRQREDEWPKGRPADHRITALDPEPWTDGEVRKAHWFGAYFPTAQFEAYWDPREGFCHNPEHYPMTDKDKEKLRNG